MLSKQETIEFILRHFNVSFTQPNPKNKTPIAYYVYDTFNDLLYTRVKHKNSAYYTGFNDIKVFETNGGVVVVMFNNAINGELNIPKIVGFKLEVFPYNVPMEVLLDEEKFLYQTFKMID